METWQEKFVGAVKRIIVIAKAEKSATDAAGIDDQAEALADEIFAAYGSELVVIDGLVPSSLFDGVPPSLAKSIVERVGAKLLDRIYFETAKRRSVGADDPGPAPVAAEAPAPPDASSAPTDAPAPDAGESIGMAGAPAQPGGAGFHV